MYFTCLPDHTEQGFDEELHFSKFGKHNIIFNAISGRSNCARHVGCLSIKTVLSGKEWYGVNSQRLAVGPGQFLILNDDQEYSCWIDNSGNAGILSIFFRREFASLVFRDALSKEEALLDTPHESGGNMLEFFQTLNDIDLGLHQKLTSLISALDRSGYNNDMVDEYLVFLLHDLIRVHKMEMCRTDKVRAIKPSTRKEIYKRLCIAKDFLHSTFMDKTDLSLISNASCLSTPQLIRQFKAAFNETPHQYLTRIRLAHAARLLKDKSISVNEITWMCGFENVSAFCRAFKSAHGIQPTSFRKMN
jgi:AraC-like DNA-binding protein